MLESFCHAIRHNSNIFLLNTNSILMLLVDCTNLLPRSSSSARERYSHSSDYREREGGGGGGGGGLDNAETWLDTPLVSLRLCTGTVLAKCKTEF